MDDETFYELHGFDWQDDYDFPDDYGYCKECGAPLINMGAISDGNSTHDEIVCPNCDLLDEANGDWQ